MDLPTTNMTMSGGHDMSDAQAAEPELVTRTTQAGIGLLTGVVVYGAAFGGLFAVAFGLVLGRLSRFGPRPTAALLAAAAFTTVYLVPSLKYPANPPSVGLPETIGYRTSLFVAMIAISIAAMIVAIKLAQWFAAAIWKLDCHAFGSRGVLRDCRDRPARAPPLNEVPEGFPADVLWNFRIASIGIQVMMWSTLGIVFGYFAEKLLLDSRAITGLIGCFLDGVDGFHRDCFQHDIVIDLALIQPVSGRKLSLPRCRASETAPPWDGAVRRRPRTAASHPPLFHARHPRDRHRSGDHRHDRAGR